jgi:hypothetical protein
MKPSRDLGDKVEIINGLDEAESLVANPSGSLHHGAEVKVQARPGEAKK